MPTKQDKINETVMEKLDDLNDKLSNILVKIAALPDELLERSDKRYASKRTEVAVDRLAWILVTFVISAALVFVFKQ